MQIYTLRYVYCIVRVNAKSRFYTESLTNLPYLILHNNDQIHTWKRDVAQIGQIN